MKYKLTNEVIYRHGVKLYRIECVESFGNIKAGDKGGFVESEDNLSHFGNAWIYDDAEVHGNARVYDDAKVYGNAEVYDNVVVYDHAEVYGNAWVYGNVGVFGYAKIYDNSEVFGNTQVYGYAKIYDGATVYGDAWICGDAEITKSSDYLVFENSWSSGRYFTWTRSNNMWRVGCFYGTSEELIKKAYEDSKLKGDCYKLTVEYVENLYKLLGN